MEEEESSEVLPSAVLGWDELAALTDPIRARDFTVLDAMSLRCSSIVVVRDRVRTVRPSVGASGSVRSTVRDRMVVRGEGALWVKCSLSDKGECDSGVTVRMPVSRKLSG